MDAEAERTVAIKQCKAGGTLASIAKSYAVELSMISRFLHDRGSVAAIPTWRRIGSKGSALARLGRH